MSMGRRCRAGTEIQPEGAFYCASIVGIHFSEEEPMATKPAVKIPKQTKIPNELQHKKWSSTATLPQMVTELIENPNYNELDADQKLTQLTQILTGKQGGNL